MAILQDTHCRLSFEVRFAWYDEIDWLHYHFYFRWNRTPLLNPKVVKGWKCRSQAARICVENSGADSFLPFIREMLDTGVPGQWNPQEPDVNVSIYPSRWDPFDFTLKTIVFEESVRERLLSELADSTTAPKKPNDSFQVFIAVDSHVFEMRGVFHGDSAIVNVGVDRIALEKFYKELQFEYQAFLKMNRLHQHEWRLCRGTKLQP